MRTELRHIFFDLDHTLWDFHANSARAFKQLFKEFHVPLDYERFMEIYRPVNLRVWDDYAAGFYTKEQVKIIRLKTALDRLGFDLPPDVILQMAERYLELLALGTDLMPGARELLETLSRQYPLHLITNGFSEVQHTKIRRAKLDKYFQTLTLSEETGELKPHPKVFRHALRKAGAFPHESVMIGDSIRSDILGAVNVGMRAVLYDPEGNENFPEVIAPVAARLTDIPKLLETWKN